MSVIEGLDPHNGDVLRIEANHGKISSVKRSRSTHSDLPWLAPALIDLQVNGYRGHDVNAKLADPSEIAAITDELARDGVTTWVPTIVTGSEEAICSSLAAVREARELDSRVKAAIPFCHVEGPFLSPQDGPRGAHDLTQIRPIDPDEVARWQAHGDVGIVTVSPHWPNSSSDIARLSAMGITVSIGHTHASTLEILQAVDAGAKLSTHLGNGIFAELARHPNPIWTQLAEDRLIAGFIGDGHHLPADTLTAMLRAKGLHGAFLVSDSVALAGSAPGIYETPVGGKVELTKDGRLLTYGTTLLAGAGVGLAEGIRFMLTHTPLSLAQVLDLATRNPGRVLALCGRSRRGLIEVGQPADLIRIDEGGNILNVMRAGQWIR